MTYIYGNDIEEFNYIINALITNDPNITELEIRDINSEQFNRLCIALQNNKAVTSLITGDDYIYDDGAIAIAEALKVNNVLTQLSLLESRIGNAGVRAITEALKVNKALTTLRLGHNEIDDTGAIAIAEELKVNKVLTELNLYGNDIGDAGGIAIAEALKDNKVLTELNLGHNDIGAAGARAIAEALKVNKSLTTLGLEDNNIGDAGTTDIAEALKTNTALIHLDLGCNNIGDTGATDIAEALKVNTALTTLGLYYNKIDDTGATDIAEALKSNKVLTTLEYDSNTEGREIDEALEVNNLLFQEACKLFKRHVEIMQQKHDQHISYMTGSTNSLNEKNIEDPEDLSLPQIQTLIAHMHDIPYMRAIYYQHEFNKIVSTSLLDKAYSQLLKIQKNILFKADLFFNKDINHEIAVFLGRADLLSLHRGIETLEENNSITTQDLQEVTRASIVQIINNAASLKNLLKIPNNVVFISDALNRGVEFKQIISNLKKITADPQTIEFLKAVPKAVGYIITLDEGDVYIFIAASHDLKFRENAIANLRNIKLLFQEKRITNSAAEDDTQSYNQEEDGSAASAASSADSQPSERTIMKVRKVKAVKDQDGNLREENNGRAPSEGETIVSARILEDGALIEVEEISHNEEANNQGGSSFAMDIINNANNGHQEITVYQHNTEHWWSENPGENLNPVHLPRSIWWGMQGEADVRTTSPQPTLVYSPMQKHNDNQRAIEENNDIQQLHDNIDFLESVMEPEFIDTTDYSSIAIGLVSLLAVCYSS